ncbi:MAG: hypothetical protein HQK55_12250 [Deltaproteobacteria bacterium]|nr:hypothetical protein [Deltaproteobacteria bacterium]
MLAEALQFISNIVKKGEEPKRIDIEERIYFDRELKPLYNPTPTALDVTTLSGLVTFLSEHQGDVDRFSPLIIHVVNPSFVRVISHMEEPWWQRHELMRAIWSNTGLRFGVWYDHEEFIVNLQAKFVLNDNAKLLLDILGNIEDGTVAQWADDGTAQQVTIKTGLATKGVCKVPNPVVLAPFRTFPEIIQPESPFILRMKSQKEGRPQIALFNCDNNAWELEAMASIQRYLATALGEEWTIIA